MSDLPKLTPGQTLPGIPAAGWNAAMDAARAVRDDQAGVGGGVPGRLVRQGSVVLVKNASGSAVDPFGVLGLTVPVIDPNDDADEFCARVAMEGGTPAADAEMVAVPRGTIADGEIGEAVVSGATPAWVRLDSLSHTKCRPDGTTDHMVTDTEGPCRILWIDTTAGLGELAWAYVLIDRGGAGGTAPDCEITVVTGICKIA